ncbi:MAG: DUF3945 domain-containing protein, partial [Prevotellaceae bacterium]|nr:DUF3945 domain-containing protein [Prevotellaceae bacterium]
WKEFDKFGISFDFLKKSGGTEKLLDNKKTALLPVSIKLDENSAIKTDARFSLKKLSDGRFAPSAHCIRKEADLRDYFGVKFTEEDRQNLLETGNLGRIITPEYSKGEKTPVLLSVDKLTNELVAFRSEKVAVPQNVKGIELTENQQLDLSQGKAVFLENMTSKEGNPFSALFQFNADKRGFEFIYDNGQKQGQNSEVDLSSFRKKPLSEEQQASLKEGMAVKINGLTDKNGKGYGGYIVLNKDTGKIDFMFPQHYEKALSEGKIKPDTRKIQEDKKQEDKQEQAQKKTEKPKKSKGMKM